jgi:hypothetical protein
MDLHSTFSVLFFVVVVDARFVDKCGLLLIAFFSFLRKRLYMTHFESVPAAPALFFDKEEDTKIDSIKSSERVRKSTGCADDRLKR